MKRLPVVAVVLFPAGNALAINERLLFAKAGDGGILIILNGERVYCSSAFTGSPQVTVSGTTITIVSPVSPPPACPPRSSCLPTRRTP